MKKVLSSLLIILGAAMLIFAIALPTYVVPKGKVLPKDIVSTTGTDPIKGNLLDANALAEGKPVSGKENLPECRGKDKQVSCFIWKDLELQSQRFTRAQEPTDDKVVTLEAGQTLFRTDREEPKNLVNATVDRVTLDRKTQMPVADPVSTLDVNAPALNPNGEASIGPFTRPGIQYQFPMGTDRRSYDYFDTQALKAQPIDYVGEEELDGEKVYKFEQTVDPVELYPRLKEQLEADGDLSKADESTLASLRLKFPAKIWGLDEAAAKDTAKSADNKDDKKDGDKKDEKSSEVELSRFYTVHRTLWVQPDTGVIVNGKEDIWQYYAKDQDEANKMAQPENREKEMNDPKRTALHIPGEWNDASRASQMDKAKEGLKTLKTMGTTVPWILGPLGLLLLLAGLIMALKRRRAERHANADYYGDDDTSVIHRDEHDVDHGVDRGTDYGDGRGDGHGTARRV